MDYKKTLSIVNELKSLDLETTPDSTIKNLLLKIMYIPLPVVFLETMTRIIRCRTVSVGKEDFVQNRIHCTYGDLANPKRKKFLSLGRANTNDSSIFYGTIETEILNGFQTASFELLPMIYDENKKEKVADFSRLDLVAGIWEIQKPIGLVILGNISERYMNLNKLGYKRADMMNNFLEKNSEERDVIRLIDDFLGAEFSKDVIKGEEYNYKISANYVDLLKERTNLKGIIYPSTKSLGAGNNVAIFPKAVRNKYMKLIRGVYSVFYDRDNSCMNEYPMDGVYASGKIRWNDYYEGLLPLVIKRYYNRQSDDNTFMKHIPITDLNVAPEIEA